MRQFLKLEGGIESRSLYLKYYLNRKLSFQSKPLYSKLEGNPLHFTSPIIRGYALLVYFKILSFIYSRKHKLLSLIESTIFSLGKSLSLSLTENFRVGRPNGLHWVIKMPNLSLYFPQNPLGFIQMVIFAGQNSTKRDFAFKIVYLTWHTKVYVDVNAHQTVWISYEGLSVQRQHTIILEVYRSMHLYIIKYIELEKSSLN